MSTSRNPLVVVVSGPGGAGKSTVVAELLKAVPQLWLSRSWTTRQRRPGEAVDAYVYVDRQTFEDRIAAGGFLEYAEFLGNLYGTPTPEAPDGFDVLLEIEVQGARQVRASTPDALLVFLEAPSAAEQEARLRGRGDPEEKVQQRLAKSLEEASAAAELNAHRVVNETVSQTVEELAALVEAARTKRQAGPVSTSMAQTADQERAAQAQQSQQ